MLKISLDLLETGEPNTYRTKDEEFLMSMENGDGIDKSGIKPEIKKIIDDTFEKINKYKSGGLRSLLQDKSDYEKIEDFIMKVNLAVCTGSKFSYENPKLMTKEEIISE